MQFVASGIFPIRKYNAAYSGPSQTLSLQRGCGIFSKDVVLASHGRKGEMCPAQAMVIHSRHMCNAGGNRCKQLSQLSVSSSDCF